MIKLSGRQVERMKSIVAAILGVCLFCSVCWAEEKTILKDQRAKDSYSLGYEFGNNLKKQQVEIDTEILFVAVRDALESKIPALGPEEIRENLLQLRKKTMVLQDRRYRERAEKNRIDGEAFLAGNKKKDGVKVLPSGLQYKVITGGNGPSPQESDEVMVNYRGTLVNGTEFDSSYSRGEPAAVHINGVIRGWIEALQLMKPGSKWQVFIPSELAYGERSFGRIPANSVLIFELELVAINKEAAPTAAGISQPQQVTGEGPVE
jgi:FKBP-type peptidyl-prolyl cis-trans isomerase FklB